MVSEIAFQRRLSRLWPKHQTSWDYFPKTAYKNGKSASTASGLIQLALMLTLGARSGDAASAFALASEHLSCWAKEPRAFIKVSKSMSPDSGLSMSKLVMSMLKMYCDWWKLGTLNRTAANELLATPVGSSEQDLRCLGRAVEVRLTLMGMLVSEPEQVWRRARVFWSSNVRWKRLDETALRQSDERDVSVLLSLVTANRRDREATPRLAQIVLEKYKLRARQSHDEDSLPDCEHLYLLAALASSCGEKISSLELAAELVRWW